MDITDKVGTAATPGAAATVDTAATPGTTDIAIAFSGAGFLIPAHAGAASYILERHELKEVAGTSAGSIIAGFLACGFTAAQIKDLVLNTDFKPFLEMKWWGWWNGLDSISPLHKWLLEQTKGRKCGETVIPFTCVSTDISTEKEMVFSTKDTPDVLIADAMVASASIPYIYPSFKYQNQRLVDGGIVCNLPVDKLVNSPGVPKVGVVIHNNHVKVDADPSLITEASRVISMLLTAGEKDLIDLAMARRSGIVLIDASPFTILDTAMTVEQKTMLWTRGYDAARDRWMV